MKLHKVAIPKSWLGRLMPIITVLASPLISLVPEKIEPKIYQALTQQQWLRVSAIVAVILIVSLAYICWLLWQLVIKNKKDDFDFINPPGVYKKKEGIYLCQPCFNDRDKEIELTRVNASGYVCRSCGQKYSLAWNLFRHCPAEEEELDKACKEFQEKQT